MRQQILVQFLKMKFRENPSNGIRAVSYPLKNKRF
jgi:hypothetical protein